VCLSLLQRFSCGSLPQRLVAGRGVVERARAVLAPPYGGSEDAGISDTRSTGELALQLLKPFVCH
jgi:hypothetical protein